MSRTTLPRSRGELASALYDKFGINYSYRQPTIKQYFEDIKAAEPALVKGRAVHDFDREELMRLAKRAGLKYEWGTIEHGQKLLKSRRRSKSAPRKGSRSKSAPKKAPAKPRSRSKSAPKKRSTSAKKASPKSQRKTSKPRAPSKLKATTKPSYLWKPGVVLPELVDISSLPGLSHWPSVPAPSPAPSGPSSPLSGSFVEISSGTIAAGPSQPGAIEKSLDQAQAAAKNIGEQLAQTTNMLTIAQKAAGALDETEAPEKFAGLADFLNSEAADTALPPDALAELRAEAATFAAFGDVEARIQEMTDAEEIDKFVVEVQAASEKAAEVWKKHGAALESLVRQQIVTLEAKQKAAKQQLEQIDKQVDVAAAAVEASGQKSPAAVEDVAAVKETIAGVQQTVADQSAKMAAEAAANVDKAEVELEEAEQKVEEVTTLAQAAEDIAQQTGSEEAAGEAQELAEKEKVAEQKAAEAAAKLVEAQKKEAVATAKAGEDAKQAQLTKKQEPAAKPVKKKKEEAAAKPPPPAKSKAADEVLERLKDKTNPDPESGKKPVQAWQNYFSTSQVEIPTDTAALTEALKKVVAKKHKDLQALKNIYNTLFPNEPKINAKTAAPFKKALDEAIAKLP